MKLAGKLAWAIALLSLIVAGGALSLISAEPYYRGRPVSHWAVDYSQKLYPTGTVPLSPSQEGLDALRNMGPQKASMALVRALRLRDSRIYEQYRTIYTRLPPWFQNRFPLRLTHQQKVTLILGSTDFLDADYKKSMVPFLVTYLENPQSDGQVAACQLLASMPDVALPASTALRRLTQSVDLSVSQTAQNALARMTGNNE